MHGAEYVFQRTGKQCVQVCNAAAAEPIYVCNEVDLVLHACPVTRLGEKDTTYYNRLLSDDKLTAKTRLDGGGAQRRGIACPQFDYYAEILLCPIKDRMNKKSQRSTPPKPVASRKAAPPLEGKVQMEDIA